MRAEEYMLPSKADIADIVSKKQKGTSLQQKEGAFLQAKGYFRKSDVSKLLSPFVQM